MTLLHFDGFDDFDLATIGQRYSVYYWSWPSGWHATAGRNGGGTFYGGDNDFSIRKFVGGYKMDLIAGIAFNHAALADVANFRGFLTFADGGDRNTGQLRVYGDGVGRICVSNGAGTKLGDSGATRFLANAYYYLEVKAHFDPTAGSVVVKLNGQTVISLTNVNTRTQSANGVDHVGFCSVNCRSTYYDDWYICDTNGTVNNDFLGDCRVITLYPNADDAVAFARSAGASNYGNVTKNPPAATPYNSSSTPGQEDIFGVANLPGGLIGTIKGVKVTTTALKSDTGLRTFKNRLKSGVSSQEGAENFLGTSMVGYSDIWEKDPETNDTWTQTAVNALKTGYKVQQ